MLRNQTGSATVLGIIVVLVLVTMSAGLLPWITNETKLAPKNRDVLEAQYAAEAGAKRAVLAFLKINVTQSIDSSWFEIEQDFIENATNKKYTVFTYLEGDASKTPVKPVTTASNAYVIQSTGKVNDAIRIVSVTMNIHGGGGGLPPSQNNKSPFAYMTFSGNNINLAPTGALNNGKYSAHNQVIGYNGGSAIKVDDPGVVFPSYDELTQYRDSNRPIIQPTFSGEKYTLTNPPPVGITLNNKTLIIDGNLEIDQNVNFENVILYVNGSINFKGSGNNFNGTNFIVANGNINCNDVNFGNSVIASYGVFQVNSINLNGSVAATGNILFKQNTNINYNSGLVNTFIQTGGNASASINPGSWKMN